VEAAIGLVIAGEIDPTHRDRSGHRRLADPADHWPPPPGHPDLPRDADVDADELAHRVHSQATWAPAASSETARRSSGLRAAARRIVRTCRGSAHGTALKRGRAWANTTTR